MGLRDKAEVYLTERRDTMLSELAARDFHEPFSYDEWLITALLRDLAVKKSNYERLISAYADLSAALTKELSARDAEKALLTFSAAALGVPYAVCYRTKRNELAADDVSRPAVKEHALPAVIPVPVLSAAIGKDGTSLVRALAADKRIADILSDDDRTSLENASITPVTGISPVAMLLTGPKNDNEPYTAEDTARLAFAARMIARFDGTVSADSRGRNDDAFEALLLSGYDGRDALADAAHDVLRSIGITQSVFLTRNSRGALAPASGKADLPKGFSLKSFKDFRTVNPSHTSILPFTFGEKPAKKGERSSPALPGKIFWFVPVSKKKRLVAAVLVFSFKGISESLPEAIKRDLVRLQRCLSAAVTPVKRTARKGAAKPKKAKPRAKAEKRELPSDKITPVT